MNKPTTLPPLPKMVTFQITIEEGEQDKLMAYMNSDAWERADKVRNGTIQECTRSLVHCVSWAQRDCGSSRVFARFLASLYNGHRVKADVSDIGALDPENFEHLMNVMRLCYMTQREPHTFVENGNTVFESIISQWNMEGNA